jgi:hypothetical protein
MTLQQENCVALSVALHRLASHDLRRREGEGSVAVRSSEGKQALDIGSFQYFRGNESGLASLQGLDCVSVFGSPTWARTRDLRINRRLVGSGCRPRQCSLSGGRTSNTFEPVSSISTGLECRIDYWILESFPPRTLVVRLCCFNSSGAKSRPATPHYPRDWEATRRPEAAATCSSPRSGVYGYSSLAGALGLVKRLIGVFA